MTIGREYYDKDGNYWQIETPYYIPPEEVIKNPAYVRGCITAEERRKAEEDRVKYKKYGRIVYMTFVAILIVLFIALVVKKVII
jgi:hypothetical protein